MINKTEAYVAGWTAAAHWGLLTDIINYTFVFCRERPTNIDLEDLKIEVVLVPEYLFFGITLVEDAPMSDIHKTLIDAFLYPEFFGGENKINEMIQKYHQHPERNYETLSSYADKTNNPSVVNQVKNIIQQQKS